MVWSVEELARRAVDDIPPGACVNLGIGMPLLIGRVVDRTREILLHSENGIIGVGPLAEEGEEDRDLVNAGKEHVTLIEGAAITDQAVSFAMLRAGHVQIAFLGAYQVSVDGDIANWKRPDQRIAGVGGAVDIAHGVPDIRVLMRLFDKEGNPKLVPKCTFPLTAEGVVRRVYSDWGIFELSDGRARLFEPAPGVDPDALREGIGVPVDTGPAA